MQTPQRALRLRANEQMNTSRIAPHAGENSEALNCGGAVPHGIPLRARFTAVLILGGAHGLISAAVSLTTVCGREIGTSVPTGTDSLATSGNIGSTRSADLGALRKASMSLGSPRAVLTTPAIKIDGGDVHDVSHCSFNYSNNVQTGQRQVGRLCLLPGLPTSTEVARGCADEPPKRKSRGIPVYKFRAEAYICAKFSPSRWGCDEMNTVRNYFAINHPPTTAQMAHFTLRVVAPHAGFNSAALNRSAVRDELEDRGESASEVESETVLARCTKRKAGIKTWLGIIGKGLLRGRGGYLRASPRLYGSQLCTGIDELHAPGLRRAHPRGRDSRNNIPREEEGVVQR
ncbi:hypothetical protein DFH09DRAFT_1426030 [Mycena vulgaris]|nr:hypothetical protein DFH09DRAFT_1426030 [Mycena vulgaris]